MKYVLGYRVITTTGLDLFFQRPDHATYLIQQVLEKIPVGCIKYCEDIYTIHVLYTHIGCPDWVVLYDVSQHLVLATLWTPASPNVLEEDHLKVKRFVVRGWYWDEASARNEVEVFAEKNNYNQWKGT